MCMSVFCINKLILVTKVVFQFKNIRLNTWILKKTDVSVKQFYLAICDFAVLEVLEP